MATPFEISDAYVADLAALNPQLGTVLGIPGHDHRWPDLSPDGWSQVADLHRRVRDAMLDLRDDPDPDQALAAKVVGHYAATRLAGFEHGDHLRDLAHMICSFEMFRDTFDMMDPTTDEGAAPIIERLATVAEPYLGYRETLRLGIDRGQVVARRQVESVIRQARSLGGEDSAYEALVRRATAAGISGDLVDKLEIAAAGAKREANDFAEWLAAAYLPNATDRDGVGRDRYVRHAIEFLGFEIDPEEIYEWGWNEIDALLGEMRRVGEEISSGSSTVEVMELLETDPARCASSAEEFVRFVETRLEQALTSLDGVHFDVPEPIRAVTVNLAPAGSPPGAYYVEPSEDFSRPGSVWYSIAHKTSVPLYQEVATAYHEGFPGHHLEIGTARIHADRLSRAQRILIWYSGFGEGWALYAERLMDELGFFELPEYRFGLLASHLFRASRVVTDIGLHLGLEIPKDAPMGAGERWHRDLGAAFMRTVGMQHPTDAASEVDRYLGWPGQAISYKVGEQKILSIRDALRRRAGASFDLKAFHAQLLGSGNMPLGLLESRMLG